MEIERLIRSYINDLKEKDLLTYERLPDIELYMEQLLGFFERILPELKTNNDDKVLTNSMVNNYVRDEVIERPINKKYAKGQISQLIEVLLLKNVLSLDELKELMDKDSSFNQFVDKYKYIKTSFLNSLTERIDEIKDDKDKLYELLLDLAIERSLSDLISKKIFYYLNRE